MLNIKINLDTIISNIEKIKNTEPKVKVCAVVKADAYSLGAVAVSRAIEEDVDMFAVATAGEGETLRKADIKKDILLLGVCDNIKCAVYNNLIITIGSKKEAEAVLWKNEAVIVHIAINTGMNRYGVNTFVQFMEVIDTLKRGKNITIGGLYTHFAYEDGNIDEVNKQLYRFQPYVDYIRSHYPNAIVHCASSGTAGVPAARMDMVRIGKAIYGGYEGYDMAVTMSSKVVAVHELKAGDNVSYGGTFTATEDMTIGVVSGGYADGINSHFTGHNFVTVDKCPCYILGRVCMDCFFIDVSEIKSPLDKEVIIISPNSRQTLCEIFNQTGVLVCDILCGIKKHRNNIVMRRFPHRNLRVRRVQTNPKYRGISPSTHRKNHK